MARQYRSTVQAKTLQAAINNSVATMTLNSITSLPNSYPYTLVIDNDLASEEIVTVTASGGGNALVITRGQDGTSAQAHDAGAVVKHMITARDLQEPQDHMDNTTTAHSMNLKAPLASPTFTGTVVLPSTTSIGTVTAAELGYVDGVTSAIQTQIDTKASSSALASHEADTTAIHGITDTSKLPKIASASAGRTMFVQAATPTALAIGDIWFQVTGL
jgi:hypothetical protein